MEQRILEKNNFCIYVITNIINNKIYIGKTHCIWLRWSQHKSEAFTRKRKNRFYTALRKYGAKNFTISILKNNLYENDAYEYERLLIKLFDTQNKNNGYNSSNGGRGNNGFTIPEVNKIKYKKLYSGEKSVRSKLTDDQARNIRTEYSLGKITTYELGIKYNVSKNTIIRIINNESYKESTIDADLNVIKTQIRLNRLVLVISGSKNNMAKLNEKDIIEIRRLNKFGISNIKIAKIYNVTPANIGYIINGKTWKHII